MVAKQVNWKGQNSISHHAEIPWPIFITIGMRDYVMDGNRHAKLCSDRFRGLCSRKYV